MIANADALLKPFTIKGLTIRNRVMSTSHAPSYGKDGKPQERYQLYHEEKARGGIGLTMFGGPMRLRCLAGCRWETCCTGPPPAPT